MPTIWDHLCQLEQLIYDAFLWGPLNRELHSAVCQLVVFCSFYYIKCVILQNFWISVLNLWVSGWTLNVISFLLICISVYVNGTNQLIASLTSHRRRMPSYHHLIAILTHQSLCRGSQTWSMSWKHPFQRQQKEITVLHSVTVKMQTGQQFCGRLNL